MAETDQWPLVRARRTRSTPARVVIVNRKGGSGKTTTAVQLAACFAAWGLRVRITDGDPQLASATYWLPPQRQAPFPTLLDVFMGECTIAEATAATTIDRVSIVPSLDTLGRVELDRPAGSDTVLATEYAADADRVDLEVMDAPPSMGALTVAMLAAADEVLITQKTSTLDRVGVAELTRPMQLVRQRLNSDLTVAGVVMIAANNRTMITDSIGKRLTMEYPDSIVHAVPHSVRAEEAPGEHLSMIDYAPESPVTAAYWHLAARLAPRLGLDWDVAPDLDRLVVRQQPIAVAATS